MEQEKNSSEELSSGRQHLKDLTEIRSLMERSSSFISLSGLSGISAGIVGLIAAFMLHSRLSAVMDYSGTPVITDEARTGHIIFSLILSAVVLLVTFALAIFFTARKAKKSGLPVWDGSAKRLVVNLFVPLVTGGLFCLLLIYQHYDWLVIPSMLVFYGLSLLNAGKFTLSEIKWLGVSEILLGLISMLFLSQAILFWAAGFGLLNILYGLVMYYKYERAA